MNTITIELCAEDRARLDRIIEQLSSSTFDPDKHLIKPAKQPQEAPKVETEETAQPKAKPAEVVEPAPEVAESAPAPAVEKAQEVTAADIQKKVAALISKGKKAEARDIVKQYAESLSTIPADKRAEVLEKLTALEG